MCQGNGILQTGIIKQTSTDMEMATEKIEGRDLQQSRPGS